MVTSDNIRKTGFNLAEASGAGNLDFPVTIRKIRFSPAATENVFVTLLGIDAHYPQRNVDATVLWDFESGITGWFTPQQTHGAQIHAVDLGASSLTWTDATPYPGSYDYRIRQITNDGAMAYSPSVNVIVTDTGTGEVSPAGYRFELHQNYPNPFNPTTTIRYSLAEPSNIRLTVWNLLGQQVTTLVNTNQVAGTYSVTFDSSRLSSGMYFYTIEATSHDGSHSWTNTRKLMLIK